MIFFSTCTSNYENECNSAVQCNPSPNAVKCLTSRLDLFLRSLPEVVHKQNCAMRAMRAMHVRSPWQLSDGINSQMMLCIIDESRPALIRGSKGWFTRSDFHVRCLLKFKEVTGAPPPPPPPPPDKSHGKSNFGKADMCEKEII